jgi:outer membrane protein assembly factor BamB
LVARPRVWPAVALVGLYWASHFLLGWAELPMFVGFLTMLASCGLLTLLFLIGWLAARRVRLSERLLGLGAAVVGGVVTCFLTVPAGGAMPWVLMTLPWLVTVWTAWLVVAGVVASARTRLVGLPAVLLLTWAAFSLIRIDNLAGDGQMVLHWRWSPTAEQLYLAERAQAGGAAPAAPTTTAALALGADDWPGFRGADRSGEVHGLTITTDWNAAAPRQVWRHRVGPGWSSVAVVGDRLFTQEQRDQAEAVVCYDAATGAEVWAHEDAARWNDGQAGPGPRATPTFADGRLYTLGATGMLNCLDAATGARHWSRDVTADAGAKPPVWGFSGSPLVAGGMVIVFAGGTGDKGLLAYRADSGGEPSWGADVGQMCFSSPQPATLGGVPQVLFLGERALTSFDAASGKVLWQHDVPKGGGGLPRSLQPRPLGDGQVLISSEGDLGLALLEVTRAGDGWAVEQRWDLPPLRSSFNDVVVHDGFVYGFDGGIFCCVDLGTGKRRWKDGRYGHGQVLLLAEQGVLLVVAEDGRAILVAAKPDKHKELGAFKAVEGKTWNHPAIAHGRLYVRNAEEMACYELRPAEAP